MPAKAHSIETWMETIEKLAALAARRSLRCSGNPVQSHNPTTLGSLAEKWRSIPLRTATAVYGRPDLSLT
jgi:hypothetical protein